MFTRSGVKQLRKLTLALVLGGSLVAGLSAEPARAAEWTQPSKTCGEVGYGTITLEMPVSAPGRLSQFYYSVDGGAWQTTSWYYSDYGYFWQWDGRQWGRLVFHGYGPTLTFSGTHRVYIYEFNGWFFTNLGYCDVASF